MTTGAHFGDQAPSTSPPAACDAFEQGHPQQVRKLYYLANQVNMGSSDYAGKIAEFNVKVAKGDDESLIPNFELMADGIKQAREALEIARKNYRATEDAHGQALNAIHRTQS